MELDINNLYIIFIVILVICSAIFACSETIITAVSRAKINRLINDGNKRAKKIEKVLKKREKGISAMLIGNNIVNILASVLATSVFLKFFGEAGILYATATMTVIVIIFAEIMPKTLALKMTNQLALLLAPLINIIVTIFLPVSNFIERLVNFIIGLFIKDINRQNNADNNLEEIRDTIELKHKEGAIFKYDKDLIDGVLDLSDVDIGEIMVHRKEIDSINIDLEIDEIVSQALAKKYTRIPLYKDDKENIVGVLNIRRLLKLIHENNGNTKNIDLKSITTDPWFVPVTNSLREQLVAFRKKKKRFAFVVDEYSSLLGIITLEDILEEIVGEMSDQDNKSQISIIKTKSGSYKVAGKTLIRDINKKLNWNLTEDDNAYNLTAFIIHNLGRIPQEKEVFEIQNFRFSILKKRGNDLVLVKVKQL